MIKGIDHIGIAVKDLKETISFLKILGLVPAKEVELPNARFAFIPVGDSEIELIEPTDSEAPIAKFIEEKGEGIHHISLKVEGIEKTLKELREKGIRLIDNEPRIGAHGVKIAFIDPASAKGMRIEFCDSDR